MSGRAIGRLALAFLWLLACLPGWLLTRPFGRERIWVRRFLAGVGRLLRLRVAVEGTPVRGNVLLAANHISWLDILALGGATEARFIAKSEIARWPLVGLLTRMGGGVFVSRQRRSEARTQADAVVRALGEGRPVVLFAEGGTGDGRAVLPFRPALFVAAAEAGVPVQPVAVDYGPGRERYAWADGVNLAEEARKMLNRREAVPVTLRFMAPLDARALDRKALAAQAQAAVAEALR